MEAIGLVSKISEVVINIDAGRKGFAIRGKAEEGRISYEKGITEAMAVFQTAQTSADPYIMLLTEYTFLIQELQFCHEADKHAFISLTKAIKRFDDAFLALQAVEEPGYKSAEKTYPHDKEYRINGFPKDAFHIAFSSHKTRLENILRSPGIDPIEKDLLRQRLANIPAAQNSFIEKQKKALVK